jgi:dTDP-4-amino-4,6-dideoxygalactose transaminase
MRSMREAIASRYVDTLGELSQLELPLVDATRVHSWHLFPIKLDLEELSIDRNEFIDELKREGVGSSVHWRPLHLHPYYQENFDWLPEHFPVATAVWERLISLPIFPGMVDEEIEYVIAAVKSICARNGRFRPRTMKANL